MRAVFFYFNRSSVAIAVRRINMPVAKTDFKSRFLLSRLTRSRISMIVSGSAALNFRAPEGVDESLLLFK